MINRFKNLLTKNYEFIFCIILLLLILIIAINPQAYINATYNGFSVWAKIILPSLFCFFILTKILMQNSKTFKIFGFLDKPFSLLYKTNTGSSYIFFMSIISGYPVGAKLINEFYNEKIINENEAKKLCSYCNTSGPMFILGSIATFLLFNKKLGVLIFIIHILSSLINGLFYRNIGTKTNIKHTQNIPLNVKKQIKIEKQTLNEIMLNTITSSLMVSGFIALSFTIIELITSLELFLPICNLFEKFVPNSSSIINAILSGFTELTNGCVKVANLPLNIKQYLILFSMLISFGRVSIHLQAYSFLSKCKIKYGFFLLTKVTHTIISLLLSLFFCLFL